MTGGQRPAEFRDLRYHVGIWTGAPGEAEQNARYFAKQVDHAASLIDAAIYERGLLAEAARPAAEDGPRRSETCCKNSPRRVWRNIARQARDAQGTRANYPVRASHTPRCVGDLITLSGWEQGRAVCVARSADLAAAGYGRPDVRPVEIIDSNSWRLAHLVEEFPL